MTFKEYWEEMRYLSIRVVHNAYAKYYMHMSNYCMEVSSDPSSYSILRHYKFQWKKYWEACVQTGRTMSVMSEALGKVFAQSLFTPKDEKTYPPPENWAKISERLGSEYKH